MVDRATFRRLNSNYLLPTPVPPKTEDNAVAGTDDRFAIPCDPYGNPNPQPTVNGK